MARKTQQDSDFDGAWKEALKGHLSAFLLVYFPTMYRLIDWSHPPEWLDKEISIVIGRTRTKNRSVDLLARMHLLTGELVTVLIHIEIQTDPEVGFSLRVARYNAGLLYTLGERVVTLVILGDLDPNWRPDEDRFECGGFVSHYQFPVCKLIERLETEWKDDWSLPVILARAQIEAVRTRGDPEARYAVKVRLFRRMFGLGLKRDEIYNLMQLLDWMVRLREDLAAGFNEELARMTKELEVPYVASFERIWLEKGRDKGRAEGCAALVKLQLEDRIGRLPKTLADRITKLPENVSTDLGRSLNNIDSTKSLKKWLDERAN